MEMEKLGLSFRQVGLDWGRKGMSDDEVVSALHRLKRVTFLTQDSDFYLRENSHSSCCVVLLAVEQRKMAQYAVRFLRHRSFRTFASRQGKVIRVQPTGIVYWERNASREIEVAW